jgi:purine-nucleoside/S-methyl-5'-thioadenosine phosphorylase / adenosine deaminase
MRWVQEGDLRFLQFPALAAAEGVWHGIAARFSIDEDGGRTPLNLGLNCGDPEQRVWANRRRLIAAAGGQRAVFAHQVHGVQVGVWEGQGHDGPDGEHAHIYLQGDALVTDVVGTVLVIQTADCQGVLLFDPVNRVVGNVHSGWRGSIRNVVGHTVHTMVDRYGCRPEHLLCAIGPSLGPCCAEFIHYRQEIPAHYWQYRRPGDVFDFWRLSVDQLLQAGVSAEQISISGICTRCNQHLFFSYRGEGKKAGRFASAIQLIPC